MTPGDAIINGICGFLCTLAGYVVGLWDARRAAKRKPAEAPKPGAATPYRNAEAPSEKVAALARECERQGADPAQVTLSPVHGAARDALTGALGLMKHTGLGG